MTEHKSIYAALAAAQQEFGQVTKGSMNPAFKSKYADLADVAQVVIPTLNKHGCAVLHYLTGEQFQMMRTEFVHWSTDTKLACDVPLIFEKNNMQGMKSATTYAKRIGLESLSGIAPEDDDGNAASQPVKKNASQVKKGGEYETFQKAIHVAKTPMDAALAFSQSDYPSWPQSFQDTVADKLYDAFYVSLDMVSAADIKDWIKAHDEALQLIPEDVAEGIVTEAKRRYSASRVSA